MILGLPFVPWIGGDYWTYVFTEIGIFALFSVSLQFLMDNGGMDSFGHAAYFGLGSYGVALTVHYWNWPMPIALIVAPLMGGLGGLIFGWFCVRLTGVYFAMLSLAFAQITYAVAFQWYDVTGGDNGLLGIWPAAWASEPYSFYGLVLALVSIAVVGLWRILDAPLGYGIRAGRDAPLRAEAIGIPVKQLQWLGFSLAGACSGLAGGLYAFFKGSVFPDVLGIPTSVDGLVMVLLGGIQSRIGPLIGTLVYKSLQISMSAYTDHWRLILGGLIVGLVIVFPQGIMGTLVSARSEKSVGWDDEG